MASSDVTKGAKADIYGQFHPVETDDMIVEKLQKFEEEVKKLPEESIQSLLQAEEKCPDLVTEKFKLIFLRSEVFNADVSAVICRVKFRPSLLWVPSSIVLQWQHAVSLVLLSRISF